MDQPEYHIPGLNDPPEQPSSSEKSNSPSYLGSGEYKRVEAAPKPPPRRRLPTEGWLAIVRDYVETIIIALLVAVVLRVFVVSAYRVASGSMEDSLLEGDYIFVNKLAYTFSDPAPGDIVVFENPFDLDRDYIKRIVATEGQTVEIIDKVLYVDGEVAAIPEMSKYIDPKIYPMALSQRDNFGPLIVPEGEVFLLGDNRDDSQDSRYWGTIATDHLKGKAVFIYFSYEPDPNAPKWEFPYIFSFFEIGFHNLFHFFERARLWRLGSVY